MISLTVYTTRHHIGGTGLLPYFLLFGRENKLEIDNLLGDIDGIIHREGNWMEEVKGRQETIKKNLIKELKKKKTEKR